MGATTSTPAAPEAGAAASPALDARAAEAAQAPALALATPPPSPAPAPAPTRPSPPPTGFAALARVATGALAASYADVCGAGWPLPGALPVVYSPAYNISFFGLEKLHPFDSCKYAKVVAALQRQGVLREGQTVLPQEASLEALAEVHTADYLHRIHHHNLTIVQVTELAPLTMLPNSLLQWRVVSPMKMHVGGTILAAGLALERGWAINVGGGMHHASSGQGMGWCPFSDIVLAALRAMRAPGGAVRSVLVVDLDAHQGNGVGRDKLDLNIEGLYILDAYNSLIFPRDEYAKGAIDVSIELAPRTGDAEYLRRLEAALATASATLPALDLVIYNAGTDVLEGDALGRLGVSAAGVVARDEMVWRWARDAACAPVVMLLSGGYTRESAGVISTSISNLFEVFGLGTDGEQGGLAAEAVCGGAPAAGGV